MRDDCEIVIYIDLWQALADGVPFSVSRNNVIVSRGINGVISADYIVKVRRFGGLIVGTEWVPSAASGPAEEPSRQDAHWQRLVEQTVTIAERVGLILGRGEGTPPLEAAPPPGGPASSGAAPLPMSSSRDRLRGIAGRLVSLVGLSGDAAIEDHPDFDDCLVRLEALTADIEAARHSAESLRPVPRPSAPVPPAPLVRCHFARLRTSESAGPVAATTDQSPIVIAAHDFNSEDYNKNGTGLYLSVVGGVTRLQRLHAAGNDEHWHLARADGITEGWIPTYCFSEEGAMQKVGGAARRSMPSADT